MTDEGTKNENASIIAEPIGLEQRINRALDGAIPKLYANGFVTTMGTGDVMVILEHNGRPTGVLNLSYTVAKTLSISLGQTIAKLEEATSHQIMTTQLIEQKLKGG